jgi:hypothetical protein
MDTFNSFDKEEEDNRREEIIHQIDLKSDYKTRQESLERLKPKHEPTEEEIKY